MAFPDHIRAKESAECVSPDRTNTSIGPITLTTPAQHAPQRRTCAKRGVKGKNSKLLLSKNELSKDTNYYALRLSECLPRQRQLPLAKYSDTAPKHIAIVRN